MTIADHSPRLSAIIIDADRAYARPRSEILGKKNCDCLPMATWPDRPVDLFKKKPSLILMDASRITE